MPPTYQFSLGGGASLLPSPRSGTINTIILGGPQPGSGRRLEVLTKPSLPWRINKYWLKYIFKKSQLKYIRSEGKTAVLNWVKPQNSNSTQENEANKQQRKRSFKKKQRKKVTCQYGSSSHYPKGRHGVLSTPPLPPHPWNLRAVIWFPFYLLSCLSVLFFIFCPVIFLLMVHSPECTREDIQSWTWLVNGHKTPSYYWSQITPWYNSTGWLGIKHQVITGPKSHPDWLGIKHQVTYCSPWCLFQSLWTCLQLLVVTQWLHNHKPWPVITCIAEAFVIRVCVERFSLLYKKSGDTPKFVVSPDITLCGWLGSKH